MQTFTTKTLMKKTGMSYNGAYGLIKRMQFKGLAKELNEENFKPGIAKVYSFTISPEEYLVQERSKPSQPSFHVGFFSNPFNLKGAKDARYNT